jgi:hypothetical protein
VCDVAPLIQWQLKELVLERLLYAGPVLLLLLLVW